MPVETKNEYTEVYTILTKLDLFSELPNEIRQVIEENKNDDYKFDFNEYTPLEEQIDNEKTLTLISYLYVKYLCNDQKEKEYLISKYKQNEIKIQEQLKEKYNPDDIFKKKNSNYIEDQKQEISMVEHKETILKRILNKIKSILKK